MPCPSPGGVLRRVSLLAPILAALAHPGALCTPAAARGGLLAGLFLAGAAGGIMHCGPMCGGFVLGQVSDRMARLPAQGLCERRRIGAALLLPYHLGRATTYAALGAMAATTVAILGRAPWFGWLSAALLALAGLAFLSQALRRAAPGLGFAPRMRTPAPAARRGAAWTAALGRLARRFDPARPVGGYALGVTLGFLPCGFLYGALTAAAGSGGALTGAADMAAFALGTVPALVVVGFVGQAAGARFSRLLAWAAPAVLAGNGLVLLGLAWLGA